MQICSKTDDKKRAELSQLDFLAVLFCCQVRALACRKQKRNSENFVTWTKALGWEWIWTLFDNGLCIVREGTEEEEEEDEKTTM